MRILAMAKVDNKIEMSKNFWEKFQKKFWRGMKRNKKEKIKE